MTEYEGFSKQDLIDKKDALRKEFDDITKRQSEIIVETIQIDRLLDR